MAENKSLGGFNSANIMTYVGLFVLLFFINCGVMYFVLKAQYNKKMAAALAQRDSLSLAYVDSLAGVDTTAITEKVDTTIVTKPEEQMPVVDTARVAQAPVQEEVVQEVDSAAIIDYNNRVKKLVKIIDKMKPVKTAGVLAKLDDDFVVEVLLKMKDRTAAKVLSEMSAARAARLSRLMTRKLNENS